MKHDFIESTEDRITSRAIDDGAAELVPAGTVLVVTRSGILKRMLPVAVTTVPVAINQDVKALRCAPGVDPVFIAEQMRWRARDILDVAAKGGITVDSIDLNRLKSIEILLAAPGEQVRIGHLLRRLRSSLRRIAGGLDAVPDELARAYVATQELLARGPGSTTSRDDLIKTELLENLLEEPIRTGLSVRGRAEPPGTRALRLSALRTGIVDLDDVRFLPVSHDRTAALALRAGDVLVSRGSGTRGHVGRAALVPDVAEHTIFPDTAFRLRLDRARIRPEWFVALWNAPSTRSLIERRTRTTAGIWKIGLRDLLDVQLRVPPIAHQDAGLAVLRRVQDRIDQVLVRHEKVHTLLSHFGRAIVEQAFSGRLISRLPEDGDAKDLDGRLRERESPSRPRRSKRPDMFTDQQRFDNLLDAWPNEGQTFESLRNSFLTEYANLQKFVFVALEVGRLKQHFDQKNQKMMLVVSNEAR